MFYNIFTQVVFNSGGPILTKRSQHRRLYKGKEEGKQECDIAEFRVANVAFIYTKIYILYSFLQSVGNL